MTLVWSSSQWTNCWQSKCSEPTSELYDQFVCEYTCNVVISSKYNDVLQHLRKIQCLFRRSAYAGKVVARDSVILCEKTVGAEPPHMIVVHKRSKSTAKAHILVVCLQHHMEQCFSTAYCATPAILAALFVCRLTCKLHRHCMRSVIHGKKTRLVICVQAVFALAQRTRQLRVVAADGPYCGQCAVFRSR
jgi:hypothetical protein